jgi:hypothetical protein
MHKVAGLQAESSGCLDDQDKCFLYGLDGERDKSHISGQEFRDSMEAGSWL